MAVFRRWLSSKEAPVPVVGTSPSAQAREPGAWAFPAERYAATFGVGGMSASTNRVASEVGVEMLRRGGNAVDAAVAVHFALAVVHPRAGNIGGGGFMVLRTPGGQSVALDFRETAPQAASRDMYLDVDGKLTDRCVVGHLAAGVPGSVAGMWEAHRRFGSLPWVDLVQPAINLAEGFVVNDRLAATFEGYVDKLRRFPTTTATFLIEGQAPRVGDRLAQPALAATLRRIQADGRDGFYTGPTAALIVAEMQRGDGIITLEDLAKYRAAWREPVRFTYRGHTVLSMPPSSSGGVTLAQMLNILAGYDLAAMGRHSADHVHVWVEAAKRAFADRNTYLADPDFVAQPVAELSSDAYADRRRKEIDLRRATPSEKVRPGLGNEATGTFPGEGASTTHYSVVDADGFAVATTTTINTSFGNLVTVEGAGFLLNNQMDNFAADPGTPNHFGLVQGENNAVAPGKRMLSSMSPTIVLDPEGRVKLVTGSPGGPTIVSCVAQMISNVVDFGMDVSAATVASRLHHQHLPDALQVERDGLPPDVAEALGRRGQNVVFRTGYQGNTQSIMLLPDGTMAGMADPRKEGGAAVAVRTCHEVVD